MWRWGFLLLVACGFNEAPHRCTKNADCPTTQSCVFYVEDGCSGKGRCVLPTSTMTCNQQIGCGCDGQPSFAVVATQNTTACLGYDHPLVSTTWPCR